MPLTLTDDIARKLFSRYLKPDDGNLSWIYGMDAPSLSLFLLFLGPLLSAWMTKHYLLGLTDRRMLLLTVSGWFKEKGFRSIDFTEIASAQVADTRDPYRVGPLIAMPGKNLCFKLKDGSSYRMGSLKDFKGVPDHGASLERIASFLPLAAAGKVTTAAPRKAAVGDKVRFVCPQCSTVLRVSEALVGKTAKCPGCGELVRISRGD
jgi:hypothetical protein